MSEDDKGRGIGIYNKTNFNGISVQHGAIV
jgi:hypothetical protein